MMYFIKTVSTYLSTGKTKKGKVLQTVATSFEYAIMRDNVALSAFVNSLDRLVDVCNSKFKGASLKLEWSHNNSYISVRHENNPDNVVFSIHYAPVRDDIAAFNVRNKISDVMIDSGYKDLFYDLYRKDK